MPIAFLSVYILVGPMHMGPMHLQGAHVLLVRIAGTQCIDTAYCYRCRTQRDLCVCAGHRGKLCENG